MSRKHMSEAEGRRISDCGLRIAKLGVDFRFLIADCELRNWEPACGPERSVASANKWHEAHKVSS